MGEAVTKSILAVSTLSYSNMVMIDHNSSRLGGNPYGNPY
jgi:hypothetical protein